MFAIPCSVEEWIHQNASPVITGRQNIDQAGLTNVSLYLRPLEDYANVDDIPDESVDFCVVDGAVRGRCVTAIIPKIKPGGWVYLDN